MSSPRLRQSVTPGIALLVILAASPSRAQHASNEQTSQAQTRQTNEEQGEHPADLATIPEAGATLDRPARSLRLWLNEEPDVGNSTLSLQGPRGELQVTGLHTMGENDLMARVAGSMPNGKYTVSYEVVTASGVKLEGSWSFTVKRAELSSRELR